MFYDTKLNNHNLPYNPFKACIVPRPIGWISTINSEGVVNIAPYSYFNAVADVPPMIMFASALTEEGSKDTIRNIELTEEFVVNVASFDSRHLLNSSSTSLPYGVSEAEVFNIQTIASNMVKPPRIKDSAISLECKFVKKIPLEADGVQASSEIVIGHVVGIHIQENILTLGKVDINKLRPIARLGYNEYALIEHIFTMQRP